MVFCFSWLQLFEQENEKMYEDLVTLKDSIQQIESKVVRIAELQEIFTEKVSFLTFVVRSFVRRVRRLIGNNDNEISP